MCNDDLVVLPGDFSWSMYLENTYEDFRYLSNLPGKKLMLKGNHDYWWTTLNKMRNYLNENNLLDIEFLYNNSYKYNDKVIVGSRGWNFSDDAEDKKILAREALRFELSIQDGINKYGTENEFVAFMHYPPITMTQLKNNESTEFMRIMKKYNISNCFYGHLHGNSIQEAVEGNIDGIELKLVSADALDFKLYKFL